MMRTCTVRSGRAGANRGEGEGPLEGRQQQELVARAFAGDNVIREFAEDAPKEVDTTLPSWVSSYTLPS